MKKSQVTLELVLAFIVILLLFVGGLDIWFNLNNRLVTQTRDYQSRRLASGQGNIAIPGEGVIDAGLVQLDEATMAKIAAIQGCDCIDDTLKKKAIDLYTRQYVLGEQIQSYNDTISSLKDAIAGMQDAYNQIPWCRECCLCTRTCLCGHHCTGQSCRPWYRTCETPCGGSSSSQCVSCSLSMVLAWSWCQHRPSCCPGDYSEGCDCISVRPNPGDEHTQARQQIQDNINETQAILDEKQRELDGYTAEKTDIDNQIAAIEPALGCCAGVL